MGTGPKEPCQGGHMKTHATGWRWRSLDHCAAPLEARALLEALDNGAGMHEVLLRPQVVLALDGDEEGAEALG